MDPGAVEPVPWSAKQSSAVVQVDAVEHQVITERLA